MVHKLKTCKNWLISAEMIVSGTDEKMTKKVFDEIIEAIEDVDRSHPTTKDFTFRRTHVAYKEIE